MKFLLIFALFISVNCDFDAKIFDWSTVKPITETKAYQKAFPWKFTSENSNGETKIFYKNGRIISGNETSPTDYPFAVGIVISFADESGWCSGSLVSRRFVLSAAQCFVGAETQMTALIGASDITRVSEFLIVLGYKKHESFNNNNLEHDIALLTLQREVVLSPSVQVIRLPNFRQIGLTFEKQKVWVAG